MVGRVTSRASRVRRRIGRRQITQPVHTKLPMVASVAELCLANNASLGYNFGLVGFVLLLGVSSLLLSFCNLYTDLCRLLWLCDSLPARSVSIYTHAWAAFL